MTKTLVAGLGNELRGDDAAGLLAARGIRALLLDNVDVEEHSADVAALADSMARHDQVVVIDAVVSGAPPGTVRELDPGSAVTRSQASSHGLGVVEALAIAHALGAKPHVRLIGIEGGQFELGTKPSPAVSRAARMIAAHIAAQLREPNQCA
ncbi:MAG TPA: hydrogenase maturation protease [Candidatus Dormibacteraeota bacterium]|nr:hydrogenase maturation protease [Candidatus Dormibacteraeota bacterium]